MSAKVSLVRVVNTKGGCTGCASQSDYTVAVSFKDDDGKVVSLAFDGRPDIDDQWGNMTALTYGVYSDCPVITGDNEHKGCSDPVVVMRNLRDALNNLNLGD
jgi:hypothetical protein